jgi:hypothetical protein
MAGASPRSRLGRSRGRTAGRNRRRTAGPRLSRPGARQSREEWSRTCECQPWQVVDRQATVFDRSNAPISSIRKAPARKEYAPKPRSCEGEGVWACQSGSLSCAGEQSWSDARPAAGLKCLSHLAAPCRLQTSAGRPQTAHCRASDKSGGERRARLGARRRPTTGAGPSGRRGARRFRRSQAQRLRRCRSSSSPVRLTG